MESVEEKRARIAANVAEAKAKQAAVTAASPKLAIGRRPRPAVSSVINDNPSLFWAVRIIVLANLFFLCMRVPEIISLVSRPLYAFMIAISVLAMLTVFFRPPPTLGSLVKRLGLMALVVASIKNDMDTRLGDAVEKHAYNLHQFNVVVTGANSGIGLSTVKHLYQQGAHVIMTCRDMNKCAKAAEIVENSKLLNKRYNTTVGLGSLRMMQLDLASFDSIKHFADKLHSDYKYINYVVLNAGSVPEAGTATSDGLEMSIASMHFANVALVDWIKDLLLVPIDPQAISSSVDVGAEGAVAVPSPSIHNSRVVIVGSTAYYMGAFHSSLMDSTDGGGDFRMEYTDNCASTGPMNLMSCCPLMACPFTNGYARSKLANILYLQQLQNQLDTEAYQHYQEENNSHSVTRRRVVTASLHPGSVSTDIHPFLGSAIMSVFLRSSDQAATIVLHALFSNNYIPSAYFDAMKRPHNLFESDDDVLKVVNLHSSAYPLSLFTQDMQHRPLEDLPKWLPNRPQATETEGEEGGTSLVLDPNDTFSFEEWFYRKYIANHMIVSTTSDGKKAKEQAQYPAAIVSQRLWDVSFNVVKQWVEGKPLLIGDKKRKGAVDGLSSKYDEL